MKTRKEFIEDIKSLFECNHDFNVLQTNGKQAILFCRKCAEIKRISLNTQEGRTMSKAEATSLAEQNYIYVSIDEFEDICNGAASVKEIKELLLDRQKMQEGEQ